MTFPINTLIDLFLPFFFDVLTLEVGTHSLSQNVGNKPTYMQHRRRTKISSFMDYAYLNVLMKSIIYL